MSLINDVLRDLERRGAPRASGKLPASRGAPRLRRSWAWWLLAAAAAGALTHWTLQGDTARAPSEQSRLADARRDAGPKAEPAVPEPVPPLLRALPRVAAEVPAPEASPANAGTGVPASGSEAMARVPMERDARPPANEVARPANPGETPATEASSAPVPEPPDPTETSGGAEARSIASRSPSEPEDSPEGDIVIRRSGGAEGPADGFASARRALARGNDDLAASRLREVVSAAPGHAVARLLLARVHVRSGRPKSAADVLEAGLERDPRETRFAALLGRLMLEQGRVARARQVLEAHAPPVEAYPEYHLLLAAAHRQAGDHEAAANAYGALAEAQPGLGAAWVGLGVSLEARDRDAEARAAYREALGGNDQRAAAFARQRLAVMPGGNGPE